MGHEPGPMERAFARQAEGVEGAFTGVPTEPDQLDLLRGEDDKLPANVYRLMRDPKRRPGRPEGSPNRKFDDLAKLVVARHGDPVLFMASLYATPLDQAIELALVAEGVPEREQALLALCDEAGALIAKAREQNWGAEKMKAVAKMVESLENAANAMKAKPGDLAMKMIGHQLQAAREVAAYVHSKKPVELQANSRVDFTAILSSGSPGQSVMENLRDAINTGLIGPSEISQIRVIDGEFSVVDQEAEADEDMGE